MNLQGFLKQTLDAMLVNSLEIGLIIILGVIALKLVRVITKKIVAFIFKSNNSFEEEKKIKTFRQIIKSVFDIFIIIICSLMIIEKLGINIAPILAAAGVVGLAIGFGSQRLVEDIITGITLLVTDQIRVGDVVKIGEYAGFVESIDLKMVVLRDLSGNVHFIRNGKIDIVTNMTKDFSYYVMDIGIAYKENVESVIQIIKQVDEELRQDENIAENILEPVEVLGLDKFDDSAVIIKARIKTKPIKQWEVGRAFNLRLKNKFDELGIEIPFPHRTLYFGNSEDLKMVGENTKG